MTKKSVLITGSSGMVGTALAEALLRRGHDVCGVDRRSNPWSSEVDDLTVIADLAGDDLTRAIPSVPDVVVHLAANARVYQLVEYPSLARENFDATFGVLEYCKSMDVDELLFASSREVYGDNGGTLREVPDARPENSGNPYAASKLGSEAMVHAYGNCYGLNPVVVRLSNVYGRYDLSDRVIPKFIARAERDRELVVYGRRKVLDFTYIDDCIQGLLAAIKRCASVSGETLDIATGRGYTLLELAETIRDRTDSDSSIHVEPNRTGELERYVADTSLAEKVLGYEPSVLLEEGIDRPVSWYREHTTLDQILGAD